MALPTSGPTTQTFTATVDGQLLKGTTGNDRLVAFGKPGSGTGTLVGDVGDDTYVVYSNKVRILENGSAGIDTVLSYWTYALSDNIENLYLVGKGPNSAVGNSLDNIIVGNAAKNVIDGGAGNDELTGGLGNDLFFVSGNDTIMDFTAGDKVNLQNFSTFATFAQVKSAMHQVGLDTVLTLSPTDTVTFKNVALSSFTTNQFVISNPTVTYKNVFDDEFNTFKLNLGTGSTDNWYPLFPRTGLAGHTTVDHGSVQYFTYPEDTGTFGQPIGVNPFSLDSGVLTIKMDKVAPGDEKKFYGYSYTSGNIDSIGSFHQTYGYFEIRAKLAAGQGLHDAFWMLPIDGTWPPELDIVEQRGSDPTHVINGVHTGENTTTGTYTVTTATTEFHTYGLDWEPDFLTWYIDGVAVRTIATPAGLDKPMYLLANLGGGSPWAGDPDATTPFPAQMQIDYIRAYASPNTVEKGVPFNKVGTAGADTMFGTSLGDRLDGGLGNDSLYGGAGNDTLVGDGTDYLDGGFGDDVYVVTSGTEVVSEGGDKGIDVIQTALSSYTLGLNLETLVYTGSGFFSGAGNIEDNLLVGANFGNLLSGGDGNDTLQGGTLSDTLNGGTGDDVVYGYSGDDVLRGNDGNDRIFGGDGNDLIKSDAGDDTIDGGTGDDNLQGGDGNDVLLGGDGNDKLDGGAGADVMKGGLGDDTYLVDNAADVVTENAGEGIDTVRVWTDSYTLTANVENMVYAGAGNFAGTGNELANKISGGDGDDTLDGGDGADTLTGGAGNNTFRFSAHEAAGDKVTDFTGVSAGGGDRLVFVGYGVGAKLTQVGTTDFYTITADAAHGGFSETIQIAGVRNLSSADYVFDNSHDNRPPTDIMVSNLTVDENSAAGTVIGVISAIDPDVSDVVSFALTNDANGMFKLVDGKLVVAKPADFETTAQYAITITATDQVGNSLTKSFTVGIHDVKVGDTVAGTAGDDAFTYSPDLTFDRFDGLGGVDTVSVTDDTIVVTADGADLVFSLIMDGNAGSGVTPVPTAAFAATNVEHLNLTGTNVALSADLSGTALANGDVTFTGTAFADIFNGTRSNVRLFADGGAGNDVLRGSSLNDQLIGGDGNDKLDGKGGADVMIGGSGNDVYYVNSAGDMVIEHADEGIDRVVSSVSYTLGDNLENLTLGGSAAINGTGNSLDNIIMGNKGANILDGGAGADRLIGGGGADTFVMKHGEADGDVVVDFVGTAAGGADVLKFVGYGPGAYLTEVGNTDYYAIHSGSGAVIETIQVAGVLHLDQADYLLV